MKKIIAVGTITILTTIGLAGCNSFQSSETPAEQPEVTTTPVVEPLTYENTEFNFSLTFPTNWGEVREVESTQALMNGAQATVVELTSNEDTDRVVEVIVVKAADKSNIGDLPSTLLKETDDYLFYFNASGDCYGKPGCEDVKYKTMLDESQQISATFEVK